MKLSVCIITKNEAEKLEKCLKSLKSYDVEIVVADTGSVDATDSVIKKYADVSGSFEWCDDFSKARNYSIGLANNDWILVLDSDEWIEKMDFEGLGKLVGEHPQMAGRLERINRYDGADGRQAGHERICRLFDRRFYEYRGRIHEQVIRKSNEKAEYRNIPLQIGHSGYEGSAEEKRQKAQRNIKLLKLDLEENGEDPYTFYQLGKSCYMCQKYDEAAEYFEQGLGFDLDPKLEYVQDMVETYAYTLLQLKRYGEMMFLKNIYDEFAVSADYIFLMGLAYMNNEMFEEAVREFEKAAACSFSKVEGCNSYKAYYNAGVIRECLGEYEKARQYYEKCGKYEPALKALERLK
jgi:hypothetical protein